jgi:hypothetical protein
MLNLDIKIGVSDQLHSPAALAPVMKPHVPTVPGPEPVWTLKEVGTELALN